MIRTELKQGDKVKVILRDSTKRVIHPINEGKIFEVIRKKNALGINWNDKKYAEIFGEFVTLDGFAPYPYTEFIKVSEG